MGAALAALSLVAEDRVVSAAHAVVETLNQMETYIHTGDLQEEEWGQPQHTLVEAQMEFVNAARKSLDSTQPALDVRIGGPLI